MTIHPVPKPSKSGPRARTPMKRSDFPKSRREFLGYCGKCGSDVMTDYCEKCQRYVQASPHDTSVRARTPIARKVRMKKVNRRRKGSAFPEMRDKPFTDWVVTQPCVLLGRWITRRLSGNDLDAADAHQSFIIRAIGGFWHRCWGDRTPAHIGKHRAQGVGDLGHVVCMCKASHQEYDEHRSRFYRVTHLTELRLQAKADELAARYQQESGALHEQGDGTNEPS